MAFAQLNYSQRLGNGPYTIAEAGCFVTADCNLLQRFGVNVDPPSLNNYFLQHNKYVHDPSEPAGTVDDIAWGTISSYDGQVVVTGTGFGWPTSNDSIVEFRYKSPHTGQEVTHFSLVENAAAHTILDSWDGVVKVSPYGVPIAYATYERTAPVVVTPPAPVTVPAFTIENIPETTEELKINTHLWDLNQRTWPGLVNNPVGNGGAGTKFTTSQIAQHILGGRYYLPIGSTNQGYNVVDCENPVEAPVVVAPPEVTQLPVTSVLPKGALPYPSSTQLYKVVATLRGYSTATKAGNHNPVQGDVKVDIGDYYIFNTYPNNSDLINVTKVIGKPGAWINKADNVTTPTNWPTETKVEPSVSVTPPVEEPATTNQTSVRWESTYTKYAVPLKFVAVKDIRVDDLSGKEASMTLPQYNPETNSPVVAVYGTVVKDGVAFYRLKTNNDPNFNFWYCVPKLDATTHMPLLLELPKTLKPISTGGIAKDSFDLAKSLANDIPEFLDDILPKWFKNKK